MSDSPLPEPDPTFAEKHKAAFLDFLEHSDGSEDFNMYAQDPGAWRELSALIPGLLVTSAGGMVPFQSEGTLHGHPYYFRYRHGYADLRVGEKGGEPPYLDGALWMAGMDYGDEYGGCLDGEEFTKLMLQLVPQLEIAPFLWQFAGRHITMVQDEWVATGSEEIYHSWGATPDEAYARLFEPSEYLTSKGWDADYQRTVVELKALQAEPVNSDDRAFPDPAPIFTVTG